LGGVLIFFKEKRDFSVRASMFRFLFSVVFVMKSISTAPLPSSQVADIRLLGFELF
jgi:hypothetical protein